MQVDKDKENVDCVNKQVNKSHPKTKILKQYFYIKITHS